MLQKRIIVCLDVKEGKTTKGVRFKGNVDVGDPVQMAAEYYRQGADELVFYDITASAEKRSIMIDLVREVARRIFVPFSVGGGISSLEEIREVIDAGAEKVSVNSSAVKNPELIRKGAEHFGSQCMVLGMDAARDTTMPSGYRVYTRGGRSATDLDALEWAHTAVGLGAGEIVLNSIDADGTKAGYEIPLTRTISEAVPVPVVASGGAGSPDHLREVLTAGKADAALIASMVHLQGYTVDSVKEALRRADIPVRIE